jgi:hypothetical protein
MYRSFSVSSHHRRAWPCIPPRIRGILAVKQKEEAGKSTMEAEKIAVPKTPPESDPRKENRNVPVASEISLSPEDFQDIRPKDDGTVQTINKETPRLAGN